MDVVETKLTKYQMVFTLNHFVPTQDLLILFLALPQTKEELKSCGITQ